MNRKVVLAFLASLTLVICSLLLYFTLKERKEVVELKNNEVIVNTQEEVKENVNSEQKEENNSNEETSITDEDIKTQETGDTTVISLDNDDVEITYNGEVIDTNETVEIDLGDNNGYGISVEEYGKENCNHCYLDKYEEGESIIYVHPITDEEVIFIITGNEDYYVSNLDFFSSSNLSLEEAFKEIEDLDFINLTEYLES